MKTASALLLTVFFGVVGCDRAPDTTRAASEDATSSNESVSEAWTAEYSGGIEAQLANLEDKLDAFEVRMEGMVGQARWDARNRLLLLRAQKQSVERKLDDIGEASAEELSDLKIEIDESLAKIEHEYDDLISDHETN